MTSTHALEVRDLNFAYPGRGLALNAIEFSALPGEVIGLVGPSGAGKSTLLLHLIGLLPEKLPPQATSSNAAGTSITVAGLSMTKGNLREIRRQIGFLFQDPDDQLFCPTVREDVAFGPLNLGLSATEAEARVRESLEQVELAGYESRSTLQLSVGERKRVCLAGILACRPSILALDEPSSNLDPRARNKLMKILRGIGGTQLIATHDLDLVVQSCSRVIVLDGGRIRADGPTQSILSDPILMERHGLEIPLRLQHPTP